MPISEKWNPVLKELISQGLSNTEIARKLNKNAHSVSDRIRISHLREVPLTRGCCSGEWNGQWKGGTRVNKDGYIEIRFAGHPRGHHQPGARTSYVPEHVLVMESHLGRLLREGEVVHHRDGNRKNNSVSNLELFASNAEHLQAELAGRTPHWSTEGYEKICAPKAVQAILGRISTYRPNSENGAHHCSGFANHPLIRQQPASIVELASRQF